MPKNVEAKLCADRNCSPCVIHDPSICKADLDMYPCLLNSALQINANPETIEKINQALTNQALAVLTARHTWPPQVK